VATLIKTINLSSHIAQALGVHFDTKYFYITDRTNKDLVKFSLDGKVISRVSHSSVTPVMGGSCTNRKGLYFSDNTNHKVVQSTRDLLPQSSFPYIDDTGYFFSLFFKKKYIFCSSYSPSFAYVLDCLGRLIRYFSYSYTGNRECFFASRNKYYVGFRFSIHFIHVIDSQNNLINSINLAGSGTNHFTFFILGKYIYVVDAFPAVLYVFDRS